MTFHLPQFHSSIEATPNCSLCSKYVIIVLIEEMSVLNTSQFNNQLNCTLVLYKLQFQDAVTLLYFIRLALSIYIETKFCTA